MKIRDVVYGYNTKHEEGFVQSEIDDLLKNYPEIDMKRFNDALAGITCMLKEKDVIVYHCDIEKALYCGLQKRNLSIYEWD